MVYDLLQIRMEKLLKEKLKRIALSKGLNVTSYIKMTLIEAAEREDAQALTDNGFTTQEENRLLASIQSAEKSYKEGKLKVFDSLEEALSDLDE